MSWSTAILGNICDRVSVGHVGTTSEFYTDETGVPFLRTQNVTSTGIHLDDVKYITPEFHLKLAKSTLSEGDIVLSRVISTSINCGIVPKSLEGANCANIILARPIKDKLDSSYLCHYLKSDETQRKLLSRQVGSAQSVVNTGVLKSWEIPLPPLAEQKRIAAILDKADAIRRIRQQAIQLADDLLRAVFLEMFGPLADRSTWREVLFSDVLLIDAPMVDPREEQYLDLLHIGPDRIEKKTGRLLPALRARQENLISKKFLFNSSYVLYSKIRPYLRKVAIPDFSGLCSADMYPVRPKDGLLTREYLWQLLLSDEFTQYTETLPDRANIPKLNRDELSNFRLKLPPIELQKMFSSIFAKYQKSFLLIKDAQEITEVKFASLSQKAFSGQL